MPSVERVSRTDAGLASELRLAVMRLRRRLTTEHDPDNELSVASMSVLGALFRHGDLTVGDLAALERVRAPSMTRHVNALEVEGCVVRRPHESDGRVVMVHLTDEGRDRVVADRRRRTEWLACRLRDLTPEERDVLRAAAPLLQHLADTE